MDESSSRAAVLVVGDLFSPAMQRVERRIEELARDGCDVQVVADFAKALRKSSADARHPDLVVICQHWPDEYTTTDVRRMLGTFPLARPICCYGPWCASDGRTRDVWPLSIRVPAALASRRIDLELEVLTGKRWPLPLTASRDEIFLFDPEQAIEAPAG